MLRPSTTSMVTSSHRATASWISPRLEWKTASIVCGWNAVIQTNRCGRQRMLSCRRNHKRLCWLKLENCGVSRYPQGYRRKNTTAYWLFGNQMCRMIFGAVPENGPDSSSSEGTALELFCYAFASRINMEDTDT